MRPDLTADALAVAVEVVNELKYPDDDDHPYGWLGNPTWELKRYVKEYSDEDPYYSLKIRFESWRLGRGDVENIVEYLEEVDGVKRYDYYFSDDQPFTVTVEIPAVEEGDTE